MIWTDLNKLTDLENANKRYKEILHNTDWKQMLKTTSKEIKRVCYQLSTLVTDGEQHIQLFNGASQDIELLESMPTYCKIISRKQTAPAKVSIDYNQPEEFKSFKIKVFVSYSEAW